MQPELVRLVDQSSVLVFLNFCSHPFSYRSKEYMLGENKFLLEKTNQWHKVAYHMVSFIELYEPT